MQLANETVLVEPPEGFNFRARAPLEPLAGPAALVMIRPTGVKLTANGSAERHLSGRVTDVAFRDRGETVGLRMDPAGCHLFPVEQ